jgi:hypothetical protein
MNLIQAQTTVGGLMSLVCIPVIKHNSGQELRYRRFNDKDSELQTGHKYETIHRLKQ